MNHVKTLISSIILIAIIVSLNTKFGSVPPLGKFFNPQDGFWANAETSTPTTANLILDNFDGNASVYFDERRVPHIFADNEYDLYFAQGYVVARDRLFQLEIQTLDASGRLAEKVGKRALNRDLTTRRRGMPYGAEKALEMMKQDPKTWEIVNAYADGVNAYIESLTPKDYPIEYKVLDIAPEKWTPIKTAHLLKAMTRTLAGGNSDDATSNTIKYFGSEFVDKFFTTKPKLNDPIIPASKNWDFEPIPTQAPDTLYEPASAVELGEFKRPEGVGSNNWAVSGSKTKSGYPILANDPHLSLTLPSIWYEIQLHAPGINSYGVTLQGTPGIVIGFNEHVAWGVTNVASDVMDWYEIKFKDDSKKEYWHDGQWKPTTTRIEEIKINGAPTVLDTVIYTHHGPVTEEKSSINPERKPAYHALRWIAHEPSNDIKAFYGLNRAKNYDDYKKALSYYVAPAQNFVFASNEGDIALWVNGKIPNKWKHQGRTVSDGTNPLYDWHGWIPFEHNPHIKNPKRGFVSSANQESAAPDYPYYLDDDFAGFERGRRINEQLAEMENITAKDMQNLQMDNFNYRAATLLPSLLEWTNPDSLNEDGIEILNLMKNWNYFMDADEIAASFFQLWSGNFYRAIFYDEFNSTEASLRYPPRDRFIEVIKEDENFEFIDNINTPEIETRAQIASQTFIETIRELTNHLGEFGEDWKWGYYIETNVPHLADIPGFGTDNLFSGGSAQSINATRGDVGPSWRMVVEVGPEVKGYGVYPGGASGNPGSPNYDSMIEPWRTGQLFELNFMKQEPQQYLYKLEIK